MLSVSLPSLFLLFSHTAGFVPAISFSFVQSVLFCFLLCNAIIFSYYIWGGNFSVNFLFIQTDLPTGL